jgi:hypothetical protein
MKASRKAGIRSTRRPLPFKLCTLDNLSQSLVKNDGEQISNISFADGIFNKAAKFEGGYVEVKPFAILNKAMTNGFSISV